MRRPPRQDTIAWDALRPVKLELMRESFVTGASFTQSLPGQSGGRWVLQVQTPEGRIDKPMPTMSVDPDYPELLGLKLLQGRMFDLKIPSDAQTAVIVNESAVKAFGWKDPLNEKIYVPGDAQAT